MCVEKCFKLGRKIPFENVVRNLELGRYKGKICSADYANCAVQPFQARKFADNLGFSLYDLKEKGLIKVTNQAGWNLDTEPTVKELKAFYRRFHLQCHCGGFLDQREPVLHEDNTIAYYLGKCSKCGHVEV